MAFEYDPPSVLSHFEPADLLDALSIGVVVLDAQLCLIYANSAAEDALAFGIDQARGRPFGDFLGKSSSLVSTLRRALETGECVTDRGNIVRPFGSSRNVTALDVTISPLGSQVTGIHLLLEFTDGTESRTTRSSSPTGQSARDPVPKVPPPPIPR